MTIDLKSALNLKKGTLLTFGNALYTFEVVRVTQTDLGHSRTSRVGVHIDLVRNDGYETFATLNDLDVASIASTPEENVSESDVSEMIDEDDTPTIQLPPNQRGRTTVKGKN